MEQKLYRVINGTNLIINNNNNNTIYFSNTFFTAKWFIK